MRTFCSATHASRSQRRRTPWDFSHARCLESSKARDELERRRPGAGRGREQGSRPDAECQFCEMTAFRAASRVSRTHGTVCLKTIEPSTADVPCILPPATMFKCSFVTKQIGGRFPLHVGSECPGDRPGRQPGGAGRLPRQAGPSGRPTSITLPPAASLELVSSRSMWSLHLRELPERSRLLSPAAVELLAWTDCCPLPAPRPRRPQAEDAPQGQREAVLGRGLEANSAETRC